MEQIIPGVLITDTKGETFAVYGRVSAIHLESGRLVDARTIAPRYSGLNPRRRRAVKKTLGGDWKKAFSPKEIRAFVKFTFPFEVSGKEFIFNGGFALDPSKRVVIFKETESGVYTRSLFSNSTAWALAHVYKDNRELLTPLFELLASYGIKLVDIDDKHIIIIDEKRKRVINSLFNQAYESRDDIDLSLTVTATTRPDRDIVADSVSSVMSADIADFSNVVL
jgi:hypothetical protein